MQKDRICQSLGTIEVIKGGRLIAVLVAATLVAVACGGGDTDTVTAEPAASDPGGGLGGGNDDAETTEVPATEAPEAEDASIEGASTGGGDADSAALGRTGPIRELAVFAPWADVDLHPFLVEVMTYPEEIPLPEGIMLTSMDSSQNFWQEGSESSFNVNVDFLPSFDRDEFRETIPALMEGIGWVASGVDEDLEYHSTQLSFSPPDDGNRLDNVYFTYRDGDTNQQPELELYISGDYIEGQTEPLFNMAIWGWILEPTVEPSLHRDSIYLNVDSYGDDISYSISWEGALNGYEGLVAFYTDNELGSDLVKGAVEVSDDPWPATEFAVTRAADAFDGDLTVSVYDDDSDPRVTLRGYATAIG